MKASRYRIVSREWDGNGTATVIVESPWPRTRATDTGARRAARTSDPMGQTRRTSIRNVTMAPGTAYLLYTVRATRLEG